jgi:secreted trypsin-like serine protease
VPARILLITALLALLLAPNALAGPPQARSSIVGGQDAAIGDWPSIAFLLSGWDSDGNGTIDKQAQCTGTVIAPQWVISAAHCAFQPNDEPVHAMVTVTGIADLNDTAGEPIAADQLVVHPGWDPQSLTGDALLIHLRSPSSRPALAIATHGGDYVTVPGIPNAAGWGATDVHATVSTDVLQDAYLELQSDGLCAQAAPGFDAATQTCAGTANTSGACKGDSGGPLLVFDDATGNPVLWGLTSYGPQLGLGLPVCSLQAPAVFSWVPAFASWISDTINSAPQPPDTNPGGQTGGSPQRPTVRPPALDTVAPVLSGTRLAKSRLRAGRRTTLSFRLSEAAAVTVTVLKKNGSRLKPILKAPFGASAGTVKRGFAARRGSKPLKPGRYVLRVAAVDTAGNRSRVASVAFRVVR